jgi:hypothetical protein
MRVQVHTVVEKDEDRTLFRATKEDGTGDVTFHLTGEMAGVMSDAVEAAAKGGPEVFADM